MINQENVKEYVKGLSELSYAMENLPTGMLKTSNCYNKETDTSCYGWQIDTKLGSLELIELYGIDENIINIEVDYYGFVGIDGYIWFSVNLDDFSLRYGYDPKGYGEFQNLNPDEFVTFLKSLLILNSSYNDRWGAQK